ncbi:MAG TPA: hypothetical protein VGO96_13890 [Pyrinomonadaceae bacterium]|jgi:hypothetical protein|nr:hypothetical protein [Pyrinomonadaceae bacterium]
MFEKLPAPGEKEAAAEAAGERSENVEACALCDAVVVGATAGAQSGDRTYKDSLWVITS